MNNDLYIGYKKLDKKKLFDAISSNDIVVSFNIINNSDAIHLNKCPVCKAEGKFTKILNK